MITYQTAGPMGNTTALELFEQLAESTWGWLADARRLGLGFEAVLLLSDSVLANSVGGDWSFTVKLREQWSDCSITNLSERMILQKVDIWN